MEDSHLPISKLTTKQTVIKLLGTDIRIDTSINGIELRVQK